MGRWFPISLSDPYWNDSFRSCCRGQTQGRSAMNYGGAPPFGAAGGRPPPMGQGVWRPPPARISYRQKCKICAHLFEITMQPRRLTPTRRSRSWSHRRPPSMRIHLLIVSHPVTPPPEATILTARLRRLRRKKTFPLIRRRSRTCRRLPLSRARRRATVARDRRLVRLSRLRLLPAPISIRRLKWLRCQ